MKIYKAITGWIIYATVEDRLYVYNPLHATPAGAPMSWWRVIPEAAGTIALAYVYYRLEEAQEEAEQLRQQPAGAYAQQRQAAAVVALGDILIEPFGIDPTRLGLPDLAQVQKQLDGEP